MTFYLLLGVYTSTICGTDICTQYMYVTKHQLSRSFALTSVTSEFPCLITTFPKVIRPYVQYMHTKPELRWNDAIYNKAFGIWVGACCTFSGLQKSRNFPSCTTRSNGKKVISVAHSSPPNDQRWHRLGKVTSKDFPYISPQCDTMTYDRRWHCNLQTVANSHDKRRWYV